MEKLITRKEAAEILGISIATLDAARNNGLISYVQYVQNGCVYFTAAGLQELSLIHIFPELQSGAGAECLRKHCAACGAGRKQGRQEVYERNSADAGTGG